jgi:segregation and condensation protein B
MEKTELKNAVETLLFITDQPIGVSKITQAVGVKNREEVEAVLAEIQREYAERDTAVQVLEIADGFQMATKSDFAKYVRNLFNEKMAMRLSTAALETLSIVAYKQPLTRAEIEQVRGVEVIAALETLLEKGLIKVAGRKESVGRPLLYGTTSDFLRRFGLRSLADLPPLDSFHPESENSRQSMAASGAGPFQAVSKGAAEIEAEIETEVETETETEPESEPEPEPEPDSETPTAETDD